jgi:hypothetical protein
MGGHDFGNRALPFGLEQANPGIVCTSEVFPIDPASNAGVVFQLGIVREKRNMPCFRQVNPSAVKMRIQKCGNYLFFSAIHAPGE